MNVTTISTSSSIGTSSETIASIGYSVGFSLAILLILVLVSYASYKCYRSSAVTNHFFFSHGRPVHTTIAIGDGDGPFTAPKGLDEAILVKYPKLVYSEVKPHEGDSIASGCSICLADYKDNDVVRLLPGCGHLFHLNCVDPWLKLHPSCPICRSKPLPTPLAEATQQN